MAENDAFWRSKIIATFGSRFIDLFQDYTPYSTFVALCHVKPYTFGADRGDDNWPVDRDRADDPMIQAESEHSMQWAGRKCWRYKSTYKLSQMPEDIESLTDMIVMFLYTFVMSNKGNVSFQQVEIMGYNDYPDLNEIKFKMMCTGVRNAIGITSHNEIIEWNALDDVSRGIRMPYLMENQLKGTQIKQVVAGTNINACLTECNKVFFWDYRWPLCTPNEGGSFVLKFVIELPLMDKEIIKIAAGKGFIIALTADHSVYMSHIPMPREHKAFVKEFVVDGINYVQKNQDWLNGRAEKVLQSYNGYFNHAVQAQMQWQRLSLFCDDIDKTGIHKDGSNFWEQEKFRHLVEVAPKIEHIFASEEYFMVLDPNAGSRANNSKRGIVIIGNVKDLRSAIVIPTLQGEQIVKVARGRNHQQFWSAQTRAGKVLQWKEIDLKAPPPRFPPKITTKPKDLGKFHPKMMQEPRAIQFVDMTGITGTFGKTQKEPFAIDIAPCNRTHSMGVLAVDKRWLIRRDGNVRIV